ncbi:MAG: HAD family hydrolase [Clostridiales bacterium]|jgi:Cof subfamily protein (haloacid dehalogenase superfamily)|nr:HAD family hydrolase [Clostridiales bacterium]
MVNKTLYISDLDGTLLNSEKTISDYSRAALNNMVDAGLNFTVATARSFKSALKILDLLKLPYPVILMNGALLYDTDSCSFVNVETVSAPENITELFNAYSASAFMYAFDCGNINIYYENLDTPSLLKFYDDRRDTYGKNFFKTENLSDTALLRNVIYFTLFDRHEKLSGLYNELKKLPGITAILYKDVYYDDYWYLEIYSEKASKYHAALYIKDCYNFQQLVGFGDNLNDIPLLEACDEFYAVKGAVPELKSLAKAVIGDYNEDGVVKKIQELFGK